MHSSMEKTWKSTQEKRRIACLEKKNGEKTSASHEILGIVRVSVPENAGCVLSITAISIQRKRLIMCILNLQSMIQCHCSEPAIRFAGWKLEGTYGNQTQLSADTESLLSGIRDTGNFSQFCTASVSHIPVTVWDFTGSNCTDSHAVFLHAADYGLHLCQVLVNDIIRFT